MCQKRNSKEKKILSENQFPITIKRTSSIDTYINELFIEIKKTVTMNHEGVLKSIHETRPIQQRDRCLPTIMEESEGLCLPLILLNRKSSEEIAVRNGSNNFSNSRIKRTVMVRKGASNEYSGPNPIPKSNKLNAGHRFPKHHLMEKVKG